MALHRGQRALQETPDTGTHWTLGAATGIPESTVVSLSAKRLRSFLSRPLGELDLRVVCIDGRVFRDHCLVVALGVDMAGRKHVLGPREGATETAAVATGLLSDLVTRGLPTDRTLLFVVDGAAGLRRAIGEVFGSRGVVQRCQVHKLRNVLGHLPERLHASVGKALRDAWDLDSADRAGRVLTRLVGSLERDHPGAAASIRAAVQRLSLTGALERTLRPQSILLLEVLSDRAADHLTLQGQPVHVSVRLSRPKEALVVRHPQLDKLLVFPRENLPDPPSVVEVGLEMELHWRIPGGFAPLRRASAARPSVPAQDRLPRAPPRSRDSSPR